MIKKLILFALLLAPVAMSAQEVQKIAYFKYYEVIQEMPEFKQMQDSIQKQAEVFDSEMKIMDAEYQKKYKDFLEQQETLTESIKIRRQQELQEIGERAMNFQQHAQQQQQQLQQALLEPIQEKIMKAVQDVGKENHFSYILETNSLLYFSPQSPDATPLVKAKLGLK